MTPALLGAAQLAALHRDMPPSALTGTPYLLCDLQTPWDEAARAGLADASCPVIGVGPARAQADVAACDAVVADMQAALPLIHGIARAPIAAAVLAHTLRLTEKLPLAAALHAESLAYATLQGGAEFKAWCAQHPPPGARARHDAAPAVALARDQRTLHLTLDRPAERNAMTVEMRDALCEALRLALNDTDIDTLCIRASGKCFSTGGDPAEFGTAPDSSSAHLIRSVQLPGRLLAACGARARVYVHGACIGSGIEFPAFAARVTAHRRSWFQLPELDYGLIPGAGGCVSIARRIGRQRLMAWVLGGQRIDAATALRWGLIDAIDPG
ncbi:enoyl-CoA hydratase/isomerase family protein [Sinimarinibacterium sp. NLF-5-8]|uniref:enoyl-CoA hydratase/isomerase family protein n=1 Tax=Sinimarinibacterium sp. NLF-5-8 TaxID=2698684 RepID=UPI00137C1F24|nr:enoyl-CoA hydratase/isomerase family protein [Sinimarinibacterium sp. NLF-5-8]QHS10367.1 enoyl-CoA hydratase/isomerase family protein [Sinimarinibacterium sp. NLF-5-8]